jgi:hypothetical protein
VSVRRHRRLQDGRTGSGAQHSGGETWPLRYVDSHLCDNGHIHGRMQAGQQRSQLRGGFLRHRCRAAGRRAGGTCGFAQREQQDPGGGR